jgi:hypothetical protein
MSRQESLKIVANFANLTLLIVCLFLISSSQPLGLSAFWGQPSQKSITYSRQDDQPLRFDKIQAAGKLIEVEADSETKKDFEGDDDWMRGLVVTLNNTSNKNIVSIRLFLLFPETTVAGPMMGFPLSFGRIPKNSYDRSYDNLLKPGEKVDLVLTDDKHNDLRSFLKSRSFSKVNNVRLKLESVIFDDDIMWLGGLFMRRDPNNPKQWNPIDK